MQWARQRTRRWGLGRLFARPRFELWAAEAAGRPLYLEVGGLTGRAARAAAARRLRERPGVPVVVLDDSGRAVYPVPAPTRAGA
jgi:hypothetical protein